MTSNAKAIECDVVIIGAGSAGVSALAEVKKTTDRVILIESGQLGTMCARTGCMPSKALIEWARDPRGREGQSPFDRVRELRDFFTDSAARSTEESAPQILRGKATLIDPREVRVGDTTVRAGAIIIATGSTPIVPDEWRDLGERVLTTETFFEQTEVAASYAIIGNGPVGLELGQALAKLGARVSVFGRDRNVGGLTDPAVQDQAIALLGRQVDIHIGPDARPAENHTVRAGEVSVPAERVLLSVGRRANVEGLGLERLGFTLDDRGVPEFDPATRRIGTSTVFIAGDVAGDRPIMHEAVFQGRVAGFNATVKDKSPFAPYPRLLIAFTDPQIAIVGASHADLRDREILVGEVDFSRQGRARLMGAPGGLLRIYAHPHDGLILGSEMICPAGEHLSHLLAFAVARGLTVTEMLKMPFYHPTLEEGLRTALVQIQKKLKPLPSPPDVTCGDCHPIGTA